MRYIEDVEIHYDDVTIAAEVELEDGVAKEMFNIRLYTDYTHEISVHPADLTKAATAKLFLRAEKMYADFLLEG